MWRLCGVVTSHEVMRIELIVPIRLIVGVFHVQSIVVDTIIMPFTTLIEHVHLFGVYIGIDHVQVQALVLLEEGPPRGRAPVIVLRDRDNLVHWYEDGLNTAEFECVKPEESGIRVELHSQDKAFVGKARLDQEGDERVDLSFVVSGT